MFHHIKYVVMITTSIISAIFTIVPEAIFQKANLFDIKTMEIKVLVTRIAVCITIAIITTILYVFRLLLRRKLCIKGETYTIKIHHGDLFKMKNVKKIIPFDECFTTSVGEEPHQIKPTSICGQYLEKYPITNMQTLIEKAHLKPCVNKSKFNQQECYEPGSIIPRDDFFLTAFVKLDADGVGKMSRDEYVKSLMKLWEELDKYYGGQDVCMPIIGSGRARIEGISKQEMLDMIIASYKLGSHKLKNPITLHIIFKKTDDFSLNKVGTYI